jgi:hypothetical protein
MTKVSEFTDGAPALMTDILGAARAGSNVRLTVADMAKAATGVFNVRDPQFAGGAVGDGVTDDTAAIQAAIDALRDAILSSPINFVPSLYFPNSIYKVTSLDFTDIRQAHWVVDGCGSTIYGANSGKPVIDLTGSRFYTFKNLHVWGDQTNTPTYGIQVAAYNSGSMGDGIFRDVTIERYFSVAGYYNFGGETMLYDKFFVFNRSTAADSYCIILDSGNYQDITSEFVTQTLGVGVERSFNEQLFIQADIRKENGGKAIHLRGSSVARVHFINSYGVSVDDAIVYVSDSTAINQLTLDMHFETTGATEALLIDNVNPSSNIFMRSLVMRDHNPFVNSALIDVTGATRTVVFDGIDITVGGSTAFALIGSGAADANKIVVSGNIKWNKTNNLSLANFLFNGGDIIINDSITLTHTLGTYDLVRRPSSGSARTRLVKGKVQVAGTAEGTDVSNYVQIEGAATGGNPGVSAGGADTDVNLVLSAKGAGKVRATSSVVVYRDNTSTSPNFTSEQDGSGDAIFEWLLTGSRSWCAGIDNSDGDKFKISPANDAFATAVMALTTGGGFELTSTITPPGTTGNQTINKPMGRVNIAAAGTSITVTNNLVTANSHVLAWVATNDGTAVIKNVVPGSGSFVVTLNAAATAETAIGFLVIG